MTRSDAINILIVDDEHANLLALEAVPDRPGENVVRTRSGEEALSKVNRRISLPWQTYPSLHSFANRFRRNGNATF